MEPQEREQHHQPEEQRGDEKLYVTLLPLQGQSSQEPLQQQEQEWEQRQERAAMELLHPLPYLNSIDQFGQSSVQAQGSFPPSDATSFYTGGAQFTAAAHRDW